mmetsp:Transcript_12621/g.17999  ORF Transcript_12621/g.17999 Transcript_12621/m.17999 type:complete len:99 (-) Transcript_12621:509-805(-)
MIGCVLVDDEGKYSNSTVESLILIPNITALCIIKSRKSKCVLGIGSYNLSGDKIPLHWSTFQTNICPESMETICPMLCMYGDTNIYIQMLYQGDRVQH